MDCKACESTPEGQLWGVYDFGCVDCCARLIASARPSKTQQELMFKSIARFKDVPSRERILERLKELT